MVLISILIFIFGLVVGSFLNCVIYRMETGQSFLRGRSFCPNCKHTLSWLDLIPVLSFVLLGGKCRYCRKRISIQYPVVEMAMGILFLLILNFEFRILNEFLISNFELILNTLYLILIASLLIIIFVFDLKHYIIPDKIIFPAIIFVFIYRLFFWSLGHLDLFRNSKATLWGVHFVSREIRNSETLFNPLIAAATATLFFLTIFLLSRGKWMGFGDVKLAFFMGLFLGFPNILAALFLAFFLGAIIGIGLIILKIKELKSQVPFGPFLIAGTFIALFWGENIVSWYLCLLK